jgi:ribonuclease Y
MRPPDEIVSGPAVRVPPGGWNVLENGIVLAAGSDPVMAIVAGAVGLAVGAVVMLLVRKSKEQQGAAVAAAEAEAILARARAEVESNKKDAALAAKEEALQRREKTAAEEAGRRRELGDLEVRLGRLEETLADREQSLEKKMRTLQEQEKESTARKTRMETKEKELEAKLEEQKQVLTTLAGMTREEARAMLLQKIEKDLEAEHANLVVRMLDRAKEEVDAKAREVISTAIQRVAADHSAEITVASVDLPNEEMKGRVIGREGRNIRAFEKASGVDVIVDDTPGVIVVSAFDGVRRETARRALEKLLKDGRIHPAKIEETVKASKDEMDEVVQEAGRKAVQDLDLHGVHPKIISLLGRLKFRTSYGQNVLLHSSECGALAGAMAGELGLDVKLATRCGFLHDIGKAVDHEVEGGHAVIGGDIARRCGEDPVVVNAIAAHHEDVKMETVYAVLTAAADAMSAARPGARRDSLERYVKRLQALEELAHRYEGVEQAFAIQAGREVRVIVNPGKVSDRLARKIAYDLARHIEAELTYPGEVKVTCVRETRVTETAK